MTEEVYRIEIPIQTVDNTEPALGQAQSKVSSFERSMARTEEQIKRMNKTRLQLIASAVDKATGVLGTISSKAKALVSKTYRITVSVLDNVTRPLRSIANFMTSTIGVMTAGAGIAGGVVIPMTISGNYEQTQIAFGTMLKDVQKANKFLSEAEDFADNTPFEFPELTSDAKLMKAFGFEIEKVLPMLTTIGDTTSGLGAGADGIERITRALGQMKAKGRLQAEELLQLQELGVPAAQILQEELGLTADQVANIGKEGIEAGRGIDALLRGMDKRFGGMMAKQSKSGFGLLSTISDTVKNKLLRQWGTGLWDGLKPEFEKVVDWLDKNKAQVKAWGESFRKVGMEISTWVVDKLNTVSRNIQRLVGSQEWKEAKTLGQKMKLAWDKVISEPFDEWWNGPGKSKITSIAEKMGRGLGGGLGGFISAALGLAADPEKVANESPFVRAGATAGKAFLESFLSAFNADKVAEKASSAFVSIQKEALKVAPGGQKPGLESWLGAALDAVLIFQALKGGRALIKGGKAAKKGFDWIRAFAKGGGGKAAATVAEETATVAKTAAGAAAPQVKKVPIVVSTKTGPMLKWVEEAVAKTEDVFPSVTKKTSLWGKIAEAIGPKLGKFGVLEKLATLGKASGKVTKGLPVAGAIIGIATSGAAIAAAPKKEKARTAAGEIGGAIGGIAGGAATGAAVGAAFGGVGAVPGAVIGGIAGAFGGEALGKWFYDQRDAIGKWFTQLPENVGYATGYSVQKMKDFYNSAIDLMKNKLSNQAWWDSIGNQIVTNTQKMYNGATTWASQTLTDLDKWWSELPGKAEKWWSQTSERVSNWAKKTYDDAVNWFSGIPDAIAGKVVDAGKGINNWFGNIGDRISNSFSSGAAAAQKHATGGIMYTPHLGLVAEAGPEAIIPLSSGRRNRGLSLWQRAGEMMGVRPYAEGGIAGRYSPTLAAGIAELSDAEDNAPVPVMVPARNSRPQLNVNVQVQNSPQYKIETGADAEAVLEIIRSHNSEIADDIGTEIAKSVARYYQNAAYA